MLLLKNKQEKGLQEGQAGSLSQNQEYRHPACLAAWNQPRAVFVLITSSNVSIQDKFIPKSKRFCVRGKDPLPTCSKYVTENTPVCYSELLLGEDLIPF